MEGSRFKRRGVVISAEKNSFLDGLFYFYLRRALRRRFFRVSIRGRRHLAELDPARPTLAFSNHTNWWDGLAVFFLTRFVPQKSFFCMMEEKQLKHYRFFTWIGAFSVDLSTPLRAAATLRYAVKLLQKPETLIWIFPQGKMTSVYAPVDVRPGTHYLATYTAGAQMLPVAFRYEFFREDRPELLIEIGAPFSALESSDERIEREIKACVSALDASARTEDFTGFETVLKPRLTINKQWERVRLFFQGRLAEFQPHN
jgi:chlorobactene lauroyltransferase